MTKGFGPGHASAVTDRPASRVSLFEVQTWFRDASGPGATDGTVVDASFLNFLVGNLIYLCACAGVDPANDQGGDTYIYDAVAGLLAAALGGATGLTAVNHDDTLDGDGTVGDPLGISPAILAQIFSVGDLSAALAAERVRAIGVESNLEQRVRILEGGQAPRASATAYGFARLGSIATDADGADPPTGSGSTWTLI